MRVLRQDLGCPGSCQRNRFFIILTIINSKCSVLPLGSISKMFTDSVAHVHFTSSGSGEFSRNISRHASFNMSFHSYFIPLVSFHSCLTPIVHVIKSSVQTVNRSQTAGVRAGALISARLRPPIKLIRQQTNKADENDNVTATLRRREQSPSQQM